MKTIFYILEVCVLAASAMASYRIPDKCNGNVVINVEWHSMTNAQKNDYMEAVLELNKRGFDIMMSDLHAKHVPDWHQGSFFFIAHRYFTHLYEQELLKVNPNLVLPYIDWSLLGNSGNANDLWQYFGVPDKDEGCVTGRYINPDRYKVPNSELAFKGQACLRRKLENHQYQTPELLGEYIRKSNTFLEFARNNELWHTNIHAAIGGEMLYAHSPSDPLFYPLHKFMDFLYFAFQNTDPQNRMTSFGGTQPYDNGRAVDADTEIPGFPGVRVRDVFNTLDLCYVYVNPNTRFSDSKMVLQNGYVPPAHFGNQNVTIPRPSPVTHEAASRFGWSQDDVNDANNASQQNYQEVQRKIENNIPVLGPNVAPGSSVNGFDPYPPSQYAISLDKSGRLAEQLIKNIIPTYNSSNGYSYGDGISKAQGSSGNAIAASVGTLFVAIFFAIIGIL